MRTHLVIALLVLLGLTSFSSISHSAIFNGNDYQVVRLRDVNWDDARTHMQTNFPGYWLATITSPEENQFIANLFSSGEYWIGGRQVPINEPNAGDGWTWVNGEGLFWDGNSLVGPYANWSGGEPNDGGPAGSAGSEQHLAMWYTGFWNDEGRIGNIEGYVMETPIPGAVWMMGTGLIGLIFLRRRTKG